MDRNLRPHRPPDDDLLSLLLRLLGQPPRRGLLHDQHYWLERHQFDLGRIMPLRCLQRDIPPMGRRDLHLHYSVDYLRLRDHLDPSSRRIPLDSSIHRLVCSCWDWS
jgi:hypothetical protein